MRLAIALALCLLACDSPDHEVDGMAIWDRHGLATSAECSDELDRARVAAGWSFPVDGVTVDLWDGALPAYLFPGPADDWCDRIPAGRYEPITSKINVGVSSCLQLSAYAHELVHHAAWVRSRRSDADRAHEGEAWHRLDALRSVDCPP